MLKHMKTAIQMTMFHIRNYGSVLQTYALQKAIEAIPGWRCETLNIRPWSDNGILRFDKRTEGVVEESNCLNKWIKRIFRIFNIPYLIVKLRYLYKLHMYQKPLENLLEQFLQEKINLTRYYPDAETLWNNPPNADVYITGSDQTLNPRFTAGDGNWFFAFLPPSEKNKRISYASSIASSTLDERMKALYSRELSGYLGLSFREASGCVIAQKMGVTAVHCCDPTLLLDKSFWIRFSSDRKRSQRKSYILSYNLCYMTDPYPMAEKVEKNLQRVLGLPIIKLDSRKGVTPYEFVDLFMNARFITTSSFHGTAFALQSENPFISYVPNLRDGDSRVYDLLHKCNAEKHIVTIGEWFDVNDFSQFESTAKEQKSLAEFREASKTWLRLQLEHL